MKAGGEYKRARRTTNERPRRVDACDRNVEKHRQMRAPVDVTASVDADELAEEKKREIRPENA